MVIFGRCALILDLFYFTVLASVLKSSSSAYCLEGKQYYDSEKKQCLPCKPCTSPMVVIATCHIYSNTKCGLPTSNGGPFIEVLQEELSESVGNLNVKRKRKQKHAAVNASKLEEHNPSFTLFGEENCAEKQKGSNKFVKKLCKFNVSNSSAKELPKINGSTNINLTHHSSPVPNVSANFHPTVIPQYNETEENIKSTSNDSEHTLKDAYTRNFFYSYLGKVIISSIVISINLLLIAILIVKIMRTCYKNKLKGTTTDLYTQKMPHPSQKPLKCRFTAVLPTKTPSEYANINSNLNSLISPAFSANSSSSNWNDNCASSTLPYTQRENSEIRASLRSHPARLERGQVEREPLITSTSEVVENANMIQLYSRIPSPNPFTMDRLLEHRRAIGCTSVENNLYVETWCSSNTPVLPRSQDSSVAPSPALSSIRKPLSSSNSSSPLTTRTFRATPVFSSFHPNRS